MARQTTRKKKSSTAAAERGVKAAHRVFANFLAQVDPRQPRPLKTKRKAPEGGPGDSEDA